MQPLHKKQAAYYAGVKAEQQAASYLQAKGYVILHQRYKTPYGEIDLVAQRGNQLVCVEVKRRVTTESGLYSISPRQQQRMMAAACLLMSEIAQPELEWRFDAMIIDRSGQLTHLEHICEVEW